MDALQGTIPDDAMPSIEVGFIRIILLLYLWCCSIPIVLLQ